MKYLLACGLILSSLVAARQDKVALTTDPIYLDYAASARINNDSLKEFVRVSRLDGNSSGFNFHAKKLKEIENKSAKVIAEKIGCNADQILFTNSATMSNNIAVLGVAYKYPGCHLITSKIEHKSVLNIFKYLENSSIQSFNSEIGTRQDVAEIAKIIKNSGNKNILFHSDISQAFGKYPTDFSVFDMATFSGYKIGSPKGIAALYVKDRKKITPIFFGSGDEFFPGSKPTALIAAFAKAVEVYKLDEKIIKENFETLKTEVEKIKDVFINSEKPSHVFSVSIKGVLLKDLIDRVQKFSFSSGCSCLGQGESNVKEAIDPNGKLPSTTLRISFSDNVSKKNLIDFAKNLKIEVEKLRKEKSVSDSCEKSEEKQKDLLKSLSNLDLKNLQNS